VTISDADLGLAAELAGFAVELAVGGGELARTGRLGGFAVTTKSSATDVVTEVDRRVEGWLLDTIVAARPDDAVLGEEGANRLGTSRVRWVLDPIDGTVNFTLGLPHYAVSVAAEVDGVVVAGCVHNPESGETYSARRGGGAHLEHVGRREVGVLTGARDIPLERAVVGTGFGYAAARRERQAAVVARLLPRIGDIRRFGAASLDICAVAAGRLDAYFEVGLKPWDYAAGLLIATEAGCRTTGLRGRAPGPELTAVAGAAVAADFFDVLTELDADLARG
jgi:myo-inositol-1(or 4)-monophosphatase